MCQSPPLSMVLVHSSASSHSSPLRCPLCEEVKKTVRIRTRTVEHSVLIFIGSRYFMPCLHQLLKQFMGDKLEEGRRCSLTYILCCRNISWKHQIPSTNGTFATLSLSSCFSFCCCPKKFSRGSWQIWLLRKTVTPGILKMKINSTNERSAIWNG